MENNYPQHSDTQQQERKGVSRLASEIAGLGLIWRETSNSDVGIDGQIEFVDTDGFASGLIVAVQVKSGASYLGDNTDWIIYRPARKHANYWREFPVPVLLAIHDPESRQIFWTDARQQLRGTDKEEVIVLPKSQTVSNADPTSCFCSPPTSREATDRVRSDQGVGRERAR